MRKTFHRIGTKIQEGSLHPFHLGAILAFAHVCILTIIAALILLSIHYFPLWGYLYLGFPFLLLALWWWYARHLHQHYGIFSFHDSMMATMAAAFPFALLFCIAGLGFLITQSFSDANYYWHLLAYHTLMLSFGQLVLCLAVFSFFLHHPWHAYRRTPSKKRRA